MASELDLDDVAATSPKAKAELEALRSENARLRARISDLQKQISNDQHPPYSAPDPDEKLIDGVLHWRETPDGEWKPMSPEKLTDLVIQLRKALHAATAWGQFHNERLPMLWPPQPVVTCKDSASE